MLNYAALITTTVHNGGIDPRDSPGTKKIWTRGLRIATDQPEFEFNRHIFWPILLCAKTKACTFPLRLAGRVEGEMATI